MSTIGLLGALLSCLHDPAPRRRVARPPRAGPPGARSAPLPLQPPPPLRVPRWRAPPCVRLPPRDARQRRGPRRLLLLHAPRGAHPRGPPRPRAHLPAAHGGRRRGARPRALLQPHPPRPPRRRGGQGTRALLQAARRGDQARPQGLQRRRRRLLQVRPTPGRQAAAAPRHARRRRRARRRVLLPHPRRPGPPGPAPRLRVPLHPHARRGARQAGPLRVQHRAQHVRPARPRARGGPPLLAHAPRRRAAERGHLQYHAPRVRRRRAARRGGPPLRPHAQCFLRRQWQRCQAERGDLQHHDRHLRQVAGGRQGRELGAGHAGQRRPAQRHHLLHHPVHLGEGREARPCREAVFDKLRESGTEIDPVLYQTMVVAYERAGLVSQAKRLLQDLKDPGGIPKETAIKILASAGRLEEAAWLFRRAASAGEVKDSSVHRTMMDLFAKNRRHRNVIEVFDDMRKTGHLPDSETIATAMNAHGKVKEFDKAAALYQAMREEGCVFSDRVHFQMISVLGAQKDFEALVGELSHAQASTRGSFILCLPASMKERTSLIRHPRLLAR